MGPGRAAWLDAAVTAVTATRQMSRRIGARVVGFGKRRMWSLATAHDTGCRVFQLSQSRHLPRRSAVHICTGTGLAHATSSPGLHQDWAHGCHICTGTGIRAAAHFTAPFAAGAPLSDCAAVRPPAGLLWYTPARAHTRKGPRTRPQRQPTTAVARIGTGGRADGCVYADCDNGAIGGSAQTWI